jgi:PTS system mannose-specific IIA component
MTVGILIIAHGDIGPALIGAASHVLGRNLAEERVASLRAGHDEAREDFLAQAQARVADLDSGDGVLLLTDLFGATPANLSRELLQPGRVAGAAGVSLPMLLRAVNYRQLPLEALRDKALTAATECSAPLP